MELFRYLHATGKHIYLFHDNTTSNYGHVRREKSHNHTQDKCNKVTMGHEKNDTVIKILENLVKQTSAKLLNPGHMKHTENDKIDFQKIKRNGKQAHYTEHLNTFNGDKIDMKRCKQIIYKIRKQPDKTTVCTLFNFEEH